MSDIQPESQAQAPAVSYVRIDADRAGQRLDNFLIATLKGVPKSRIYRIIRDGQVRVNRKRCKQTYRLEEGDEVRIPPVRMASAGEAPAVGQGLGDRLSRSLIHEDDHLLIYNKPFGLAVHGGSGVSLGLIESLRVLRPEDRNLELVHRLDRDTSGAIMLARNRPFLRRLQRLMQDGGVEKRYWLLCQGFRGSQRIIEAPLLKLSHGNERVVRVSREGKASHTDFRLLERFGAKSLEAFGDFSKAEIAALGCLLDYLELSQAGAPAKLAPPVTSLPGTVMAIDPAARASLEIERTLQGQRKGSLLDAIDRTVTAPGARLLAEQLARPSTDPALIAARLDAVGFLVSEEGLRADIREALKAAGDPARALSRLCLERGGPRDLAGLARALKEGERLVARFARQTLASPPEAITQALDALSLSAHPDLAALVEDIARALVEEPPLLTRDGGFVATGWNPALDELRTLRDQSRKVIAGLQKTYSDQTGVAALKVKHNHVLGYFIEVTAKQADALMGVEPFIHRQTMANAVRFTTAELGELESKIASAASRAIALELEIFAELRARTEALAEPVRRAAEALARLDVWAAAAAWAVETNAVRPEISTGSELVIEGGRHPVVEAALARSGEGRFTPNDCSLDGEGKTASRLLLVTGPNMAGKSTYLRQCAIITILAQAGLFVPAKRAVIGIADRLFSRVGAADDLARGRSTFMAEMIETAAILNQAGPKSLVILDEIGRGTATWDGLSIAWAAVEHLHAVNRCRALFATHYHELTRLADELDATGNVSLKAREWQGELVFLHEVGPGPADRSYGVEVAKRAGLPAAAVKRAQAILAKLESDGSPAAALADLPLFSATPVEAPRKPSRAEERLKAINPDELTPREALDALYALKGLLDDSKP